MMADRCSLTNLSPDEAAGWRLFLQSPPVPKVRGSSQFLIAFEAPVAWAMAGLTSPIIALAMIMEMDLMITST